jgi:hypothetical protein
MTNEVVKKQYKIDPKTEEGFGEDKKRMCEVGTGVIAYTMQ